MYRAASILYGPFEVLYMVDFQNRGPQYRPLDTIVLIMGTPQMVPLISNGTPHIITVQAS